MDHMIFPSWTFYLVHSRRIVGSMSEPLRLSDRTRLRRKPGRGSHERAVIEAILDEALVCHVGFVIDAAPVVIPTTFVRIDDLVYLHGAVANRMLQAIRGVEACITVTLLDALVLARTAFHHSVNYRSVVIFGAGRVVEDPAEKRAALAALIDRVVPERSTACRLPDDKELAATAVLAVPLDESSAKMRSGPPLPDEGADAELPYWAGIVPLETVRGAPIPASGCAVPFPIR
jgi:nitroimidazol reductase NimA-like FMN-containing flavoprotein (pyridoxamine 5'-phosphate oxidase superfamily)